jgi:serine/threonine protein kinase
MNQQPSYELFEELGRGVNTVVYRAYDLSLGREVAVKELDETARRDPRHRERFLREAQFLAQFEHDNVLRVYSVDTERGWIIMELMKGTLATLIANGPSDPDLVRSILKQTLDALAFLHEKNKVHGTVRPTNLLINEAGRVKLSEFEQTDVGGELRAPQGSKKYLAPELIRPEFGGFSPSLDLYPGSAGTARRTIWRPRANS